MGGVDGKEPLAGPGKKRLGKILRPFFAKYDDDGSGQLNEHEFGALLKDLDEHFDKNECDLIYNTTDVNKDGEIGFDVSRTCSPCKLRALRGLWPHPSPEAK